MLDALSAYIDTDSDDIATQAAKVFGTKRT